jgi:hypothetical protein
MAEVVSMERWERLLALVDILEPLPSEEFKRLAASRSFISLGAGDTLVLEEDRRSLFLRARLVRGIRCVGGLGSYHLAGLTFVEVHLRVHFVGVI